MKHSTSFILILVILIAGCGHAKIKIDQSEYQDKQGVVVTSSKQMGQLLLNSVEGAIMTIDDGKEVLVPWGKPVFVPLEKGEHRFTIWFDYISQKAGKNSGCFTISEGSALLIEYKTPLIVTSSGNVDISSLSGARENIECNKT